MPRPITWQSRLRDIHRQVTESARNPYTRADIERLFRLGTKAAQKLVPLMRRVEQGNTTVIEREDLLEFLNGCMETESLRAHLDELKRRPPKPSRRMVKLYTPSDFEPGNLQTINRAGIRLSRGEVTLLYHSLDGLLSLVNQLVTVLGTPEFERRYCFPREETPAELKAAAELRLIQASNRFMAKSAAACSAVDQGAGEIAELLRAEADSALEEVRKYSAELGEDPADDELLTRREQMLASLFPHSSWVPSSPCDRDPG